MVYIRKENIGESFVFEKRHHRSGKCIEQRLKYISENLSLRKLLPLVALKYFVIFFFITRTGHALGIKVFLKKKTPTSLSFLSPMVFWRTYYFWRAILPIHQIS